MKTVLFTFTHSWSVKIPNPYTGDGEPPVDYNPVTIIPEVSLPLTVLTKLNEEKSLNYKDGENISFDLVFSAQDKLGIQNYRNNGEHNQHRFIPSISLSAEELDLLCYLE